MLSLKTLLGIKEILMLSSDLLERINIWGGGRGQWIHRNEEKDIWRSREKFFFHGREERIENDWM